MPRYMRQRNRFSCGPIAILNSLKWAGQKVTYEGWYRNLKRACGCNRIFGTNQKIFDKNLRYLGSHLFTIRKRNRPKLSEIEKHVTNGGAVLLSYYWNNNGYSGRHFALIVDYDGKYFTVVNDSRVETVMKISRKGFKRRCLRFQRTNRYLRGWFLRKK